MASRILHLGIDRRSVQATLARSGNVLLAKFDAIIARGVPSQRWFNTIERALRRRNRAQRYNRLETKHASPVQNVAPSARREAGASRVKAQCMRMLAAHVSNPILGLIQEPIAIRSVDLRVRVLVVDDHEPWRAMVRKTLQCDATVIGEAVDGRTAVELVQLLQPDLVLLDIEMPTMNGFEAAEQIALGAPQTKIIFLSLAQDPLVIEHALSCGACGYVLKTDAGQELLPAIRAAVDNKRFVSTGAAKVLRPRSPAEQ